MTQLLSELSSLHSKNRLGGGPAVLERWKARGEGKLGVRERVEKLLDVGSPFLEFSALAGLGVYEDDLPGAGIVTGIGRLWVV